MSTTTANDDASTTSATGGSERTRGTLGPRLSAALVVGGVLSLLASIALIVAPPVNTERTAERTIGAPQSGPSAASTITIKTSEADTAAPAVAALAIAVALLLLGGTRGQIRLAMGGMQLDVIDHLRRENDKARQQLNASEQEREALTDFAETALEKLDPDAQAQVIMDAAPALASISPRPQASAFPLNEEPPNAARAAGGLDLSSLLEPLGEAVEIRHTHVSESGVEATLRIDGGLVVLHLPARADTSTLNVSVLFARAARAVAAVDARMGVIVMPDDANLPAVREVGSVRLVGLGDLIPALSHLVSDGWTSS